MRQKELDEILSKHKKWLKSEKGGEKADLRGANLFDADLSYADLRGADLSYAYLRGADLRGANLFDADLSYADLSYADLSYAYLRGADLRGANLDFSCFPLWCGGLDVNIDDRQAVQLLYHIVRNVLFSQNTSDEVKKILSNDEIITLANKFHRVVECGKIKLEEK